MSEENWITGKGRLKIANREVEIELTVPTQSVPLKKMLPVLQFLTDTVVQVGIENAAAKGEVVSCAKGCGACCRQVVPLSITEAEHLRDYVENTPEPRRTVLRERFRAAVERITEAKLIARYFSNSEVSKEELLQFGLEYFALGIACPFLEEESCSIHADRPLSCREYLVSSSPKNCEQPTPEAVSCVEMPTHISGTARTLSQKFSASATPTWIPLIQILSFKHSEEQRAPSKTGQEWVSIILKSL